MSVSNQDNCIFCGIPKSRLYKNSELAFAAFDLYPVSPGHVLIIPFRHVSSFFELNEDEVLSVSKLLKSMKDELDSKYSPQGYNIGINVGQAAGQTIEHAHLHLIPRYKGDISDPVGGVRNIIPGKGNYLIGKK